MKIRLGFVSNSSSSNFIAFAVSDKNLINKLIKAEGVWKEFKAGELLSQGFYEGGTVNFYGYNDDVYHAGWDLCDEMLENKTLSQLRQEFVQTVKKELNIDIDVKCHVGIESGEIGSG